LASEKAEYTLNVMAVTFRHWLAHHAPTSAPVSPARGTRPWVAFYFVAPLLMAVPLGWYGAGLGSEMPFSASMILWSTICLLSWWCSDGFSQLLALALGRHRVTPVVILTCGYLLNMAAASVYNPAVVNALLYFELAETTPFLEQYFELERSLLDPSYLWMLGLAGLPGWILWLTGNYLLELLAGVPRVRHPRLATPGENELRTSVLPSAPSALPAGMTPTRAEPRFLQRLTRLTGLTMKELVAIEAEDHYIQVHSLRGKELVYYRFRDAMDDLQSWDGLQIHRSAWVNRSGIERLEGRGRQMEVVLVTGDRCKVSMSFRGALLNAGLNRR